MSLNLKGDSKIYSYFLNYQFFSDENHYKIISAHKKPNLRALISEHIVRPQTNNTLIFSRGLKNVVFVIVSSRGSVTAIVRAKNRRNKLVVVYQSAYYLIVIGLN